jgi:hypothetical protein
LYLGRILVAESASGRRAARRHQHRRDDPVARDTCVRLTDGKRLFERDALINGNFEVIVSGHRKGVGSSRETAVQAEKWSGIRLAIAASFAPIHVGNNINQGVLMGDHKKLLRLAGGEGFRAGGLQPRVHDRAQTTPGARGEIRGGSSAPAPHARGAPSARRFDTTL